MRLLIFLVAAVLLIGRFLGSPSSSHTNPNQTGREVEIRWRTISSFGVPFAIAEVADPEGFGASFRRIDIQLDASNFTEQKLKPLFLGLATSQPQDKDLFIFAYSERSDAEYAIRDARSLGFVFKKSENSAKADGDSPQSRGRVGSKKLCRASYVRTAETEEFTFATDSHSNEYVRVVLRAKVIPYTGVADVDIALAAREGDRAKVIELLSLGTDVDAISEDGSTPMMLAVLKGHDTTFQLLLGNGANANTQNFDRWTALMYACANGDLAMSQRLIEAGARINDSNDNGDSALSLAVYHRSEAIVKVLVEKGARLGLQDDDGNTALHAAVRNCDKAIVLRLVAAGASPYVRNNAGETALDIACRETAELERIVTLLPLQAEKAKPEYAELTKQYVADVVEGARVGEKKWAEIIRILEKH